MTRRMPWVMFVLLVAGCATPERSPDSPYYVLPKGSRLVLQHAITIPTPGVSVWLQHGEVRGSSRDRYAPACKLEMRTRPDTARTVEPDTFLVTRVAREEQSVANDRHQRYVRQEDGDGGGPMAYEMRTMVYLESERQPEVFRLTCAHWDRPWYPQHLTLNQIKETLRGLFRVEPADE